MALNFYTGVAKGLKVKVRTFWGLMSMFVEVTGERLVGGPFCPHPSRTEFRFTLVNVKVIF